ncbi:MAG: hypothetical protein V4754_01775 [Pseudomonadota bacterium]
MADFYDYFKENMESLGLIAPISLFGTQQLAIGSLSTMLAYIEKYGTKVTVREMIGAGTKLDLLITLGAMGACYYAGGVVGSLAVAAGRTMSGGTSLADVLSEVSQLRFNQQWLPILIHRMPAIYDASVPDRKYYKYHRYI